MLSYEAKALESDVNNLLGGWCNLVGKITEGINVPAMLEENTPSIRDVNTSVSANSSLELGLEERYYRQSHFSRYGIVLDDSFSSDFNDKGSRQLDYDFSGIEERSNCLNISLLHIPEQQKYLKVLPSDNDDSMKLETINGKEYFVKLKELEMNDQGELVMTLKSTDSKVFLESTYDSVVLKQNGYSIATDSVTIGKFENKKLLIEQEQLLKQGLIKIDTALSNIFKNLQVKAE